MFQAFPNIYVFMQEYSYVINTKRSNIIIPRAFRFGSSEFLMEILYQKTNSSFGIEEAEDMMLLDQFVDLIYL